MGVLLSTRPGLRRTQQVAEDVDVVSVHRLQENRFPYQTKKNFFFFSQAAATTQRSGMLRPAISKDKNG